MKLMYPGSFLRIVVSSGLSPQTRSLRSSGSNRSRSASELLLDSKRPSFLASRRFAKGKPPADDLMMYPGYAIFYVNSNVQNSKRKQHASALDI
jgi:hypothetical protein